MLPRKYRLEVLSMFQLAAFLRLQPIVQQLQVDRET
jgi:hypothetical protein